MRYPDRRSTQLSKFGLPHFTNFLGRKNPVAPGLNQSAPVRLRIEGFSLTRARRGKMCHRLAVFGDLDFLTIGKPSLHFAKVVSQISDRKRLHNVMNYFITIYRVVHFCQATETLPVSFPNSGQESS
jgi:hypothetical protein